jgi:hypothetical protein
LTSGQPADRLDVERWNEAARYLGVAEATYRELRAKELRLQASVIVDGGTLSNFPVWLFDVDAPSEKLCRPTFGFTLTGGRGVGAGFNSFVKRMPWAVRFGFDIFHTAQEAWDTRFVSHSTRVRTVAVDAGNVGTTEFNLAAAEQQMLLNNGHDAATRFLDRFDLAEYENTYHRGFGEQDTAAPELRTDEPSSQRPLAGAAAAVEAGTR